jgi:flagellar basal-body rod modification protein FlgD
VNFAPITGASTADAAGSQSASKAQTDSLQSKDAFLQLLVAQIKNQNPLNPADGVEFLSQLAQFSQLEQTMGIRDGITGLQEQLETMSDALTKAPEGENHV